MQTDGDLLSFYQKAHDYEIATYGTDKIDYFAELSIYDLTIDGLFEQLNLVTLAAHWSWDRAEAIMPALKEEMLGWNIDAIAQRENLAKLQGYIVLNNQRKVNAIAENATKLACWSEADLAEFIGQCRLISRDDPKSWLPLTQFGYMADITKFHLARNLGLDFCKPDLQLTRAAEWFGFGSGPDDVGDMCELLSNLTGHRIGVVDHVLWRYVSEVGLPTDVA